jgi:oxygen-independent coproporphyrinogen-3 oxidase
VGRDSTGRRETPRAASLQVPVSPGAARAYRHPVSLPLASETAIGARRSLLEVAPANGARVRGAYLHVPFCRHKCHYCDFYSFVDTQDRQEAFVERLERELAAAGELLEKAGGAIETVFIGGGTPTMLRPPLLARMLAAVRRSLPLAAGPALEWTVEANPETVDREVADTLVAGGVNRTSLGAQSFTPRLLAALERDHRIESVGMAVGRLRDAGIANVNLDLIFGVPGSTLEDWAFDLDAALALAPDHLSAYGLTYEPNTPLAVKESRGEVEAVEEDLEAAMYEHASDRLAADGFRRYEISNWAKPGCECRHNLLYWRNESWLAFGPSASGHLDGLRFKVVPRLGEWLESTEPWPLSEWERLDASGTFGEELMLSLRLAEGLDAGWLEQGLARFDPEGARRRAIEAALADGRLERAAERVRLSPRGMLLANTLLSELV